MRGKTCVWVFWALTTVLSACYGALSLYTFIAMTKLKKRGYKTDSIATELLKNSVSSDKGTESTPNKWGLYAATLMSFASVAFYVVFTLLVLLRKSFKSKAATGYGIIVASAGQTAMLLLLSALVLHAAKPRALFWKNNKFFTSNDYLAYWGTFCLGYIMAFIYAINCLILLFFKPALDYEAPPPAPVQSVTHSQQIVHDVHDVESPVKPVSDEHAKPVADDALEEPKDQKKGWSFKGAWGNK